MEQSGSKSSKSRKKKNRKGKKHTSPPPPLPAENPQTSLKGSLTDIAKVSTQSEKESESIEYTTEEQQDSSDSPTVTIDQTGTPPTLSSEDQDSTQNLNIEVSASEAMSVVCSPKAASEIDSPEDIPETNPPDAVPETGPLEAVAKVCSTEVVLANDLPETVPEVGPPEAVSSIAEEECFESSASKQNIDISEDEVENATIIGELDKELNTVSASDNGAMSDARVDELKEIKINTSPDAHYAIEQELKVLPATEAAEVQELDRDSLVIKVTQATKGFKACDVKEDICFVDEQRELDAASTREKFNDQQEQSGAHDATDTDSEAAMHTDDIVVEGDASDVADKMTTDSVPKEHMLVEQTTLKEMVSVVEDEGEILSIEQHEMSEFHDEEAATDIANNSKYLY